jgi:hypothetical protein
MVSIKKLEEEFTEWKESNFRDIDLVNGSFPLLCALTYIIGRADPAGVEGYINSLLNMDHEELLLVLEKVEEFSQKLK